MLLNMQVVCTYFYGVSIGILEIALVLGHLEGSRNSRAFHFHALCLHRVTEDPLHASLMEHGLWKH